MKSIRVKKAFTLIELLLVISLISIFSFLIINSSSFKVEDKKEFSLIDLKEFLLKNYKFEDEISFVCIEDNLECFISIDKKIDEKQKIKGLFSSIPDVYKYDSEQIKVDFSSVRIDDIDFDVFFKYTINSDFKNSEYILDTLNDKVYVFNSLYKRALEFDSLNDVYDNFEKKIEEVKDAF